MRLGRESSNRPNPFPLPAREGEPEIGSAPWLRGVAPVHEGARLLTCKRFAAILRFAQDDNRETVRVYRPARAAFCAKKVVFAKRTQSPNWKARDITGKTPGLVPLTTSKMGPFFIKFHEKSQRKSKKISRNHNNSPRSASAVLLDPNRRLDGFVHRSATDARACSAASV